MSCGSLLGFMQRQLNNCSTVDLILHLGWNSRGFASYQEDVAKRCRCEVISIAVLVPLSVHATMSSWKFVSNNELKLLSKSAHQTPLLGGFSELLLLFYS